MPMHSGGYVVIIVGCLLIVLNVMREWGGLEIERLVAMARAIFSKTIAFMQNGWMILRLSRQKRVACQMWHLLSGIFAATT